MRRTLLILSVIFFAVVLIGQSAWAATYTWNNSGGNWSTTTNWSPNGTPGAGDDVIIGNSSYNIVIDVDTINVNSLTIIGNAGTITFSGAGGTRYVVVNTFTMNGSGKTFDMFGSGYVFSASTTNVQDGTFTLGSSSSNNVGTLNLSGGVFNGQGTVAFDQINMTGGVFNANSATYNGTVTATATDTTGSFDNLFTIINYDAGTFNAGTSTFKIKAETAKSVGFTIASFTAKAIIDSATSFHFKNLVIDGEDTSSSTGTVQRIIEFAQGSVYVDGTLTRMGDLTGVDNGTGTLKYGSSGTVKYDSTFNSSNTIDAEWPISDPPANAEINATVASSDAYSPSLSGDLTFTSGTLNLVGGTLTVQGNVSGNGTINDNTTLKLAGTTDQSYGSNLTLNKFTVDSSGTVTMSSQLSFTDNGQLTVSGGTLDFNGAGKLTGSYIGNLTLTVGTTTGGIKTGGQDLTGIGTITATAGKITFDGTSIETLPTGTIQIVEINNAAGVQAGSGTLTISDNADIVSGTTGQLIFTSGTITTGSSNTLRLGEGATVTGAGSAKYVIGPLQKYFVAGDLSFAYPIGTAAKYRPATFAYTALTGGTNNDSIVEIEYSTNSFTTGTLPDGISQITTAGHYLVQEKDDTPTTKDYNFTGTYEDGNFSPESRNRILAQASATPTWTQSPGADSTDTVNNTATGNGFTALPSGGTPAKIAFGSGGTTTSWTGGNSNWSISGNWAQGVVPDSSDDVTIDGATVTISGSTAAKVKNLTVGGTSAATLIIESSAASPLDVYGTLTVGANGKIVVNSSNGIKFAGSSYDNSKTTFTSGSVMEYSAGTIPADDYTNCHLTAKVTYLPTGVTVGDLEINLASGVETITGTLTVSNSLIFTSGNLTTKSTKSLFLAAGATVSGAASGKMVIGPLQKSFTAIGSFVYPVGAGASYQPATFNCTTYLGTATTVEVEYSTSTFTKGNIPAGFIDIAPEHYIVKNTNAGDGVDAYSFTGYYNESNFSPETRNKLLEQSGTGPDWTQVASQSQNLSANTITGTGITTFPSANTYIFAFGGEALTGTVNWDGATDTDWSTDANWDPDLATGTGPESTQDVVINSTANSPEIGTGDAGNANTLTINSNTLTLSGSGTLAIANNGILTLETGGKLIVNNTAKGFTLGTGASVSYQNGSTVEYQTADQAIPAGTYHNLIVNGTGAYTFAGNVTINGDLTINNTITSITFPSSVTFAGSSDQQINGSYTGALTFTTLVVDKSGGTFTDPRATSVTTYNNTSGNSTFSNVGSSLTVTGTTTIDAGTVSVTGTPSFAVVDINGGTLDKAGISGNLTIDGGSFTGDVTMSGSGTVTTTSSTSFVNLTIDRTSNLTFANGISVTGTFTKSNTGTVDFDGGLTVSGNASISGGTLGGAGDLTFNSNLTVSTGTPFDTGSSSVVFSGGNAQAISGTTLGFYDLTVNKSANGITTSDTVAVAGTYSNISGNATFNNALTLNVTGTNSYISGGTVGGSAPKNFVNLTVSGGEISGSSTTTISGVLSVSGGTVGGTTVVNGDTTITGGTISDTVTLGDALTDLVSMSAGVLSATATINGDLHIEGSASITGTTNLKDDLEIDGSSIGGTFKLNGSNGQTISGLSSSYAFANLEINETTGNVTSGKAISVSGNYVNTLGNFNITGGLTVDGTTTLTGGILNSDATLNGNIVVTSGSFGTGSSYTVTLGKSGSDQTITGTADPVAFKNLTVNIPSYDLDTSLNLQVDGTLTLTSGDIKSGSSKYVKVASAISGGSSSSMVVAPLRKEFTTTGAFTYPVGDGTDYRPAAFEYVTASGGGSSVIEIQFSKVAFNGDYPPADVEMKTGTHYIVQEQGTTFTTYTYKMTGTYEDAYFINESRARLLRQIEPLAGDGNPDWELQDKVTNNVQTNSITCGPFSAKPTDNFYFAFGRFGGTVTVAELTSFTARDFWTSVLLEWDAATEQNCAGYHILRSESEDGPYARITDNLIPSQGGPFYGASYNYEDQDVTSGKVYYYQLEEVDYDGTTTIYGPASAGMDMR